MTAVALLEHFARIAEAPDAVGRLRRLVLDLAVRGKLVPQDANDEPAAELLKRIEAEKDRLIKTGEIRKPKPLPEGEQEEFPYRIPPNWSWSRLADVSLRIHYGYTASATNTVEHVRLLRITDIQNNRVDWQSVPGCAISDVQAAQYALANGDILIARTGGTIGKSFLVKDVPLKAVFASYLIRVQGSREVFDRFLKLFLESPVYWSQLEAGARGAGQPNVNGRTLGRMAVSLPPLAEQHRIVAKVDELMALCDELEAAQAKRESRRDRLVAATLHGLNNGDTTLEDQRHTARFYFNHLPRLTTRPEHIRQLRQTILDLAVQGKLVHQDPNDEPASSLIDRIREERSQTEKRGLKPPPPIDSSETPFSLPAGWAWANFPELGLFGRGKSKHRPRNDPSLFENGAHPLVQTGDVARANGVIWTSTNQYNERGLAQSAKWPEGTLCITIAANIADTGILGFDACFPDSVVGFVPAPPFPNARYFEYFMRTTQANLLKFAPATAQKNINLGVLTKLLIPLPPLVEQHRIVAKVDELMALCDDLAARLTDTADARHALLQATLSEALASTQATVADLDQLRSTDNLSITARHSNSPRTSQASF